MRVQQLALQFALQASLVLALPQDAVVAETAAVVDVAAAQNAAVAVAATEDTADNIVFTASQKTYDAIVIGAGLSGLSAAKALKAAGKSFIILEARDRVGGRVKNQKLKNGGVVELGAAFIGPTQDAVISLASELGLELYEEYNEGNNILYQNGTATPFPSTGPLGAIPPVDEESLVQVVTTQYELDAMAATVDVQAPWAHPEAAAWDSITLNDFFLSKNLTTTARMLLDSAVNSIFSVEADELSLLYSVAYVAAAGNETTPGTLERLTTTTDGAQMWKVNGGTELLATKLAAKLGSANIKLSSPVRSVTKLGTADSSPYAVTLRNGDRFSGKHVIVAMSPPLAGSILYLPSLPASRQAIHTGMKMGVLGKAIAIYSSPFWRADGLTGQVISDAGLGRVLWEQAPKDASASTWGGIMAFLEADRLRAYLTASDKTISSVVQKDFVNYFGAKAKAVIEWVVVVWNREEFSRGGPTAIAGPGIYSTNGPAIKARVGNIHFAGTEASDYWIGYMDGAIRAGARAAAEVV